MFDVDWKYLLQILIPPILRRPKMLAWLSVITSQVRRIYAEFTQKRAFWKYDINFNGQLIYIQKKLQDSLNCPDLKILDGELKQNPFLHYNRESQLPIFIYNSTEQPNYLYFNSETQNTIDFIVAVPCNLSDEQINQLKSILEFYKLLETNYKLQTNG